MPPDDPPKKESFLIPLLLAVFEILLVAALLLSPLPEKIKNFERELWRDAPYSQEEVNDPRGMYQIRTLAARIVMVGGLILLPVLLGVGAWRWVKGRRPNANRFEIEKPM